MGVPWLWSGMLVGSGMLLALLSPGRTPPSAADGMMTITWERDHHGATRMTASPVALARCRDPKRRFRPARDAADGRSGVSCLGVSGAAAAPGAGGSDRRG